MLGPGSSASHPAKWGESGTRDLRGGGVLIGPKTALLSSYGFTAIVSIMEHVKNVMVDIFLRNHFIS
jgi:hypothetical protein